MIIVIIMQSKGSLKALVSSLAHPTHLRFDIHGVTVILLSQLILAQLPETVGHVKRQFEVVWRVRQSPHIDVNGGLESICLHQVLGVVMQCFGRVGGDGESAKEPRLSQRFVTLWF